MSGLEGLTQDVSIGRRLFGGEAAERSEEIASRTAQGSLEESRRQFDIGQARLEPFTAEAVPAFQLQSALAGARGPEEQAEAFTQFRESPATQFLKESGLALSGQGTTGERRRALERFNQGLAEQDFSATFNRLGTVAGSGQAAASTLAGAGEEAARQSVQQQEAAFRAQQQGQAAQQAATGAAAETGAGLASFFAGGGQSGTSGFGSTTVGVPLRQQNFREFA